jgi:hypothetical protein
MAGIDYSIPGQIKGIQVESPMNAMAQAMQLRNMQESSQMNALKMQEQALKAKEYQRGVESRNKLALIHADPKVKIGSPEYLERVYTEVPDLYNDVATKIANRENVLSQIETREAAAEKSRFDLDQAKKKREIETLDLRLKQFNDQFPAYNIQSEQDVEDRIVAMSNDETLGPLSTRFGTLGDTIARNKAEFRSNPRSYVARISGVSADKILAAAEEKENADFSQDQLNRVINKQPLISIDEWRNTRGQPQAAPANASAAPSTSADAAMPTEAAVTTADGVKQFPNASFKGDVGGVDFLDPTAQALYTLASDPRNKDQAPALRDMADKMQAEHVKRLEEDRKRNQLTGDFLNVTVAEDKIAELSKNPTELNLKKIANLRQQIKAANEGKAPKNYNIVKLPPQEQEFEKELGSGQAKAILKSKEQAEDAREMLDTVNIGRGILKSGAITGAGADFFVGLNQALKTVGVDFGYADASANSQAYVANIAQNVGKLIKLFGAGTGLSDADRKYAIEMAGGRIALDRKALEKILDIQERAAKNVIGRHNKKVKGIKSRTDLNVELDDEAAPKRNAPAPYSDPDEERRYQEFKAKQKGK